MSITRGNGRYTTPEGSPTWEYVTTMCCALLIFCVGCLAGWNSPSFSILMRPDSPIHLNATEASNLASVVSVGHLIAPLLTIVVNRFGRQVGLYVTGVPIVISFGIIIAAESVWALYLARFIGGLSLGLIVCFVPMYMGEVMSPRLRGSLVTVNGTMQNGGILFMYVFVPYLSIKMMACICLSIATISTLSIWFVPESPYFLVMRNKMDEAEGVLEKLRGKTDVTEDLNLIKETIRCKNTDSGSVKGGQEDRKTIDVFKRLFAVPGNRKALIINLLFLLVVYLGGYVTILVYGHIIFDAMNSGLSGHICMIVTGVLKTTCNITTGFIIDKFGRRPLLLNCGIVSGTCLLIAASYFYLMEYTEFDVTPYKLVAPCALFATVVAINIGLMPVQIVVQSETIDTDVKALATCLLGIGGGIMACISVKSYLLLAVVWNLGHCVPFFILSAITYTSVIVIFNLLPETKGKTLLQIQKDLSV